MINLVTCIPAFAEMATLAYIGPGAGLSAIGALLALLFAVIVALFGFVWYPIRRVYRSFKRNSDMETTVE